MGHDDLCSLSLIIALMTESHFALADKITNYVDVETFPGGETRTGYAHWFRGIIVSGGVRNYLSILLFSS